MQKSVPSFASFFLGGFECSSHRRNDGVRLDLLATTKHDQFADSDFKALRQFGILTYRDGLRWHAIETEPGVYDWANCETLIDAASRANADVIWDLCHYGWPDWIDVWSENFPVRFAAFAGAAAKHITDRGLAPKFCVINEISFLAWAGGEVGQFFPGLKGRGFELKTQLCKAAIQGSLAVRNLVPDAMFVSAEPLINVVCHSRSKKVKAAASWQNASQYEATDMMLGTLKPELGGHDALIDVVGLNFYPGNQWNFKGPTIYFGHYDFRPLRQLLRDAFERYRKPLLITETGAESSCRSSWLHYVCSEVHASIAEGIPVLGVCIYPVLEFPGWDNDRICAVGLLSEAALSGERRIDVEFAAELLAQQNKLGANLPPR